MKNTKIIAPQRLKGFNDFFAEDMLIREYVINLFKKNFEKYGYEPLETPSLELTELLLGISGSEAEKLFYRFQDPGGRDVMLKYEVMTSMCRAVAQNINNLPMPYKRYQIQRVWRSENAQKGRYREFTQCDADTLGSKSMQCDAEFIEMGLGIVKQLGFEKFVARLSSRKFVDAVAEYLGLPEESFYSFFVTIDKLKKIGVEGVIAEMVGRGIEQDVAKRALGLLDPSQYKGDGVDGVAGKLMKSVGTTEKGREALNELIDIDKFLKAAGVDSDKYTFDTSLARGLASYTGPVWEFEIMDGGVGSIAGCGRYDNVIERYIGMSIPATGGSFGIERVCDIIKDRNMLNLGKTNVQVMIALFDQKDIEESMSLAKQIRESGLNVMVYPDAVGFKKQFEYADKKGINWVVVQGPDEKAAGVVNLKDMRTRSQEKMNINDAVSRIVASNS